MSFGDLLRLPPAIMVTFVVMLWPAIWAAALMVVSLAGDVIRQRKRRTSPGAAQNGLMSPN
jgi:hypothetical protein